MRMHHKVSYEPAFDGCHSMAAFTVFFIIFHKILTKQKFHTASESGKNDDK